MKKFLKLSVLCISLFLVTVLQVKALTAWKYEDWQADDYGTKTKVSDNITNLKGEAVEDEGMKKGPYNKASKAKLSDGIKEEVHVGLDFANYEHGELFELSIAINKQEAEKDPEYLTEAVVMTQRSGDKFVLTAGWDKSNDAIATIDANGVYTYRWEYKKENDKIKVRFTVLDYGTVLGTTDFVELNVADASKATDFRYLWACNIKANYGVDIYTTLPPKPGTTIENPSTADINLWWVLGFLGVGSAGLVYLYKTKSNY